MLSRDTDLFSSFFFFCVVQGQLWLSGVLSDMVILKSSIALIWSSAHRKKMAIFQIAFPSILFLVLTPSSPSGGLFSQLHICIGMRPLWNILQNYNFVVAQNIFNWQKQTNHFSILYRLVLSSWKCRARINKYYFSLSCVKQMLTFLQPLYKWATTGVFSNSQERKKLGMLN